MGEAQIGFLVPNFAGPVLAGQCRHLGSISNGSVSSLALCLDFYSLLVSELFLCAQG